MTQRMVERQIPVKVAQRINTLMAAAQENKIDMATATPEQKARVRQQFSTRRTWLERAIIQWVEDEVRRATEAAVVHNQHVGWNKATARIHSVIEAGNTIGGIRATVTQMLMKPLEDQEPMP